MPNPPTIKTPRTMSRREFDERLIKVMKNLTRDLTEIADRLDAVLGPPPRRELALVEGDEDDA
jgi:hypothetical protein